MSPEDRQFALDPPPCTAELPGIGGHLREQPEDFKVTEDPAYSPDGRPEAHLLFTLTKRGWTTEAALRLVARHCDLPARELGSAGLKDRDAVTEQWISAPYQAAERLATFDHPDIQLGPAHPHGNKLRRGHLRGNLFELVIRGSKLEATELERRVTAKIEALGARGGLENLYGTQRFGKEGKNLDDGLKLLSRGNRRASPFLMSAGQSALFNLYHLHRREAGALHRVLAGDLLRKRETGGLFESCDPDVDQARLDAQEIDLTGPIFGGRMRGPTEGTPSAQLERETLARAGLTEGEIRALGRRPPGSRRVLRVPLPDFTRTVLQDPSGGPSLQIRFQLPSGSYATRVCLELQEPT